MINKRWLLGTAAVLGLLLVLVLSVPIVARWQLEQQLGALFAEPATVKSVSINPFTGHLVLQELTIGDDIELALLDLTVKLVPLFSSVVHIEQAQLSGLHLPLAYTQQHVAIGKLLIPLPGDQAAAAAGAAEASPLQGWQLDELKLADIRIGMGYLDNAHVLLIKKATIAAVDSKFTQPVRYDVDLDVDGNDLQALGEISLATPMLLTLQLELLADLADYQAYLPQPLVGTLVLNQEVSLQMSGDNTLFSSTGSLQVDNLALAGPESAAITQLGWAGVTGFTLASGESPHVTASGQLQLDNIVLTGTQPLSVAHMDWSGTAQLSVPPDDTLPKVATTGLLQASDIVATPWGSLGQLVVGELRFNEAGLVLAEVLLKDLDALLRILPDGSIAGMPAAAAAVPAELAPAASSPALPATEAPPATAAEPAVAAATPAAPAADSAVAEPMLQVLVEHIGLTGQVRIIDESAQPQVDILLQDLTLQVDRLGQGETATFDLQGRHQEENQTGVLQVQGSGRLLDQPLNAELQVLVSEFELHQLSPYLGNGIRSGRLQLDAEVKIVDSHIAAQNRVRINGLTVDKALAGGNAGGEMPVSLALDLLRDGDGMIDLEIPLQTDLADFSVDTSDIVQTALINAARRAAIAYVTQALQPLGTLLLIKDLAEVAARPRFKPLAFAPASAVLAGDSLAYANKIKDLLLGRPALTITLCGVATDVDKAALMLLAAPVADPAAAATTASAMAPAAGAETAAAAVSAEQQAEQQAALQTELRALAEARSAALTGQLVAGGVDVARLYSCRSTYVADQSEPRIDISL